MKRILIGLFAALLAFPALAQIPGGNEIAIGRTPVIGGTNNQCLYVAAGKVGNQACGGSGTVTSVSVVSANGLAGSVATATTTPAITLSTSINSPVLAGNGTALAAATTTGTGSTVVLNNGPTLIAPVLGTPASGVATNLTGTAAGLTAGTVTTNANLTGPVTSSGNATSFAAAADRIAYLCVTWTGGGTTVTRNVGYTATITMNAAGDYTVTSGTALPAAATWTYGMYAGNSIIGSTAIIMVAALAAPTTTALRVISLSSAFLLSDAVTYWACAY